MKIVLYMIGGIILTLTQSKKPFYVITNSSERIKEATLLQTKIERSIVEWKIESYTVLEIKSVGMIGETMHGFTSTLNPVTKRGLICLTELKNQSDSTRSGKERPEIIYILEALRR